MDDRLTKHVAVYYGDMTPLLPEKLPEAIRWLQGKLEEVPVEHRADARIEIGSISEYGSDYPTLRIEYRRPETDEEMADRREAWRLEFERTRDREIATLRHLQGKYSKSDGVG